jgi:TatA/E family protein of Tat protein translocase
MGEPTWFTRLQGGKPMLALISDTGIIVLVAAIALLFGANHIPKLARNIGEAGKEFRKAHAEMEGPAIPVTPANPAPSVAPVAEASGTSGPGLSSR